MISLVFAGRSWGAFAEPRPLMEGAAAAGDVLAVLPVVYHALWGGGLQADLTQPLHEGTVVGPGRAQVEGQDE